MSSADPVRIGPPSSSRGTLALVLVSGAAWFIKHRRRRPRPKDVDGRQHASEHRGASTENRLIESRAQSGASTAVATSHSVEVVPPLLQAVAAFAAAIFLAFAFRQPNVSPELVILGLTIAGVTVVGAGLWAWRARISLGQLQPPAVQQAAPWRAFGPRWKAIAVVDACLLLGLLSLALVQGLKEIPNHASAYDGQDPAISDCRDSARPVEGQSSPVEDTSGRVFGEMRLVASYSCTTLFVEIAYPDPTLKPRDEVVVITVRRPEDRSRAVFKAVLSTDSKISWGNMLANHSACVEAEVVVVKASDGSIQGRPIPTRCVLA